MSTGTNLRAPSSEPSELQELLAELRGYVLPELDEVGFDEEITALRYEPRRG